MKASKKLISTLDDYRREQKFIKFEIMDKLSNILKIRTTGNKNQEIKQIIEYIQEHMR